MNENIFVFENVKEEAFNKYIESIAINIVSPEKSIPLTRATAFPDKPGVYCIFENGAPIYVGETGSLKGRMKDIFRTKNHSFRRTLGKKLFPDHPEAKLVSSKKDFPFELELKITEHMELNLKIVAFPVIIGRKEVEEKICFMHKTLFNNRGARGIKL